MSLKSLTRQNYVNKSINNSTTPSGISAPVISSIIICDSNYTNLDDTALDPAGSYVKLIGSGFKTGCTVYFNNESVTTTFVSASEVRIQTPATTVGAYNLMLFNPLNAGGAIYLNLSVSNYPSFTTPADTLGSYYEANTISNTIVATGDTPLSYSLYSGSLPDGATLNSDGTITGTSPLEGGSTTYPFVVNVKDAQGQDATRSFSLTINTDPVTWSTPSDNQVITAYEYTPISNVTMSASSAAGKTITYSANTLPGGIALSGNTIYGTNNTVGNTYTRLTATAATTGRTATRDVIFNINADEVTWSNPSTNTSYSLTQSTAMSNVVLAATSAAGFGVQYTANTLPTGVTLNGDTISGTPTTEQTVYTQLTATANTTSRAAYRYVTWTVSIASDTYFKNTTLLLSANTTMQTASFANDNSINNSEFTVAGDTKPSSLNPYETGYYSYYYPANGAYHTFLNSAFNVGPANAVWTVEMWVYPITSGYLFCIGSGGSYGNSISIDWGLGTANKFKFFQGTGGSNINEFTTTGTYVGAKWYHLAVTKDASGVIRMFVNGVQDGTATNTTNAVSTGTTAVINGAYDNNGTGNNGGQRFISNLRFVKDHALYTANFTPSTKPLIPDSVDTLLTCRTKTFEDNSNIQNAVTIGGSPTVETNTPFTTKYVANTPYYSTYFDGTSDYLSVPDNSNLELGSSNFTIEFWINLYSSSGQSTIFAHRASDTTNGPLAVFRPTGTTNLLLYLATGSSGWDIFSGTTIGALTVGQWAHVSICRSGSTFYSSINGIVTTLGTSSSTIGDVTSAWSIGGDLNNNYTNGSISNFRIVKGTALYTANFTPSATPLTAISGTQLLTCQDSTFKDNSTNAFTLTQGSTNPNARPVPISPFTSSYHSTSFNGSSSYLTATTSSAFPIGTEDFTVEMWLNKLDTWSSVNRVLLMSSTSNSMQLWVDASTSQIKLSFNSGATPLSYTASSISTSTWFHLAITRSGNDFTMYINGSSVATGTNSGSFATPSSIIIGNYTSGTSNIWNGLIHNLRIVRGTAIVPPAGGPTSPVTAVSGTSLLTCNSQYIVDESVNTVTFTQTGSPRTVPRAPFTQPTGYSSTVVPTTYGSAYFDQNGDYLSTPYKPVYYPGTSDFTVEFWMYHTNWLSGYGPGIGMGYKSTPTGGWTIYRNTILSNGIGIRYAGQSGADTTDFFSNSVPRNNVWEHWALVRSGSTIKWYKNGVLDNSASISVNITDTDTTTLMYVGYSQQWSYSFGPGYLSDVRYIKGTALYTSNFVPPTNTQLTNVANTQLLTCQSNGPHNNYTFKDESGSNSLITKAGNPTIGTFSPYGDNWSVYFPAAAYTTTAASPITFGANANFTVEGWVNMSVLPTSSYYFMMLGSADQSTLMYWSLSINSAGKVSVNWYDGSSKSAAGATTLTLGTWYHVSFVATNGVIKIYLNGTSETLTGTTTLTNPTGNASYTMGADRGNHSAVGYFSNVRMYSSAIRSANFDVPTTPYLPDSTATYLTAQSNRFIDNSVNNRAITVSGAVIQKYSPFSTVTVPKYYSTYFNGSSDYLTTTNTSAFDFGTGDFTVESWYFPTTLTPGGGGLSDGSTIISTYPSTSTITGWSLAMSSTGYMKFSVWVSGTQQTITSTTNALTTNAWYHVAVTKSSGTYRIFVNGQLVTFTGSISQAVNTGGTVKVGALRYDTYYNYITGYLSNVRVVKGTALYTETFTPSTSPLTTTSQGATASQVSLLTCQSNTIIDNSTNKFTITAATTTVKPLLVSPFTPTVNAATVYDSSTFGGSMYFDGTGDYISTTTKTPLVSNDYTIECWVYHVASPNPCWIWDGLTNSGTGPQIFVTNSGSNLYFYKNSATSIINASITTKLNAWTHYAFCRVGTTVTAYVNGVAVGTPGTDDTTSTTSLRGGFGARSRDGAEANQAYFSDFRITTGVALYKSNFYPGSTPLIPTSTVGANTYNSSVFISGRSAGVIDASKTVNLETAAEAKVTNFSPYHGSYYSYYFNGSTDYLTFNPSTSCQFGTNDFTIECWIYPTKTLTTEYILDMRDSTHSTGFVLAYGTNVSGRLSIYNPTGNSLITENGAYTKIGQWNHIAYVRQSGVGRLMINGVMVNISVTDSHNYNNNNTTAYIGSRFDQNGSVTSTFPGYISNMRVLKGTALYTSVATTQDSVVFTPPTTPLTAIANTSLLTAQSNKFIDNSTNAFTLTSAGSIKVATQNPFQVNSGQSYYFDGTGDYLTSPNTPSFGFGTGDYTIEFWLYLTSIPGSGSKYTLMDFRATNGSTPHTCYVTNSAGTLYLGFFNGTSDVTTSSQPLTVGSWYHCAWRRASSTLTIFVNGVQAYSAAHTTDYLSSRPLVIGASVSFTEPVFGYISDLRITKGVARTITVPTSPHMLK